MSDPTWSDADLKKLSYLWDGSDPNWVLWQLDAETHVIYNLQGHALIVELDDLADAAKKQMIKAGCKVITSPPEPVNQ